MHNTSKKPTPIFHRSLAMGKLATSKIAAPHIKNINVPVEGV
jgi:hypothetical protein